MNKNQTPTPVDQLPSFKEGRNVPNQQRQSYFIGGFLMMHVPDPDTGKKYNFFINEPISVILFPFKPFSHTIDGLESILVRDKALFTFIGERFKVLHPGQYNRVISVFTEIGCTSDPGTWIEHPSVKIYFKSENMSKL